MDQLATIDQATDAVIEAFNSLSADLGYGSRASAWFPIEAKDLVQVPVPGGIGARPVDECRNMAMYVIAQHVLFLDPFRGEVQIPLGVIGSKFNRSDRSAHKAVKWACRNVKNEPYAAIRQMVIKSLTANGLRLFNTGERFSCE